MIANCRRFMLIIQFGCLVAVVAVIPPFYFLGRSPFCLLNESAWST